MKIKKIQIENLRNIDKFSGNFAGNTAIITGANDVGKSTFLKSLPDRIRGIKPADIVKHGEKEGTSVLELTDGTVFDWSIDHGREKLTITTSEGVKGSVTKEIGTRYFPPKFDIDKFLQATPAEKFKIFQKAFGIDFGDLEIEFNAAFEARRDVKRDLQKAEARSAGIADAPAVRPNVEAHQISLDCAVETENKIKRLESELAELSERFNHLTEAMTKRQVELQAATSQRCSVEKLKDDLRRVQKVAELYDKASGAREAITESDILKNELKKHEEILADIRKRKQDIVDNCALPAGFEIKGSEVVYNGFSLDKKEMSSSAITIAALKLASVNIGKVRTLYFDASYLDNKNLLEIEAWAKGENLQLLIERPDFEAGGLRYEILQDNVKTPELF